MLPAILTNRGDDPFGSGQRTQIAGQGGAFHPDLLGQRRMTYLAGAGDVREKRVLCDGELLARKSGVIEGGEPSSYPAHLRTEARTKLLGSQRTVNGFGHR